MVQAERYRSPDATSGEGQPVNLHDGRNMTLMQRVMEDARIRESDFAFLRSCGIVADLEPTPEEVECPK